MSGKANPSPSTDPQGEGRQEERRWLISVCDECDEIIEANQDFHRHREGFRSLPDDVEVVPAERAEAAEALVQRLEEERDELRRCLKWAHGFIFNLDDMPLPEDEAEDFGQFMRAEKLLYGGRADG